MAARPQPSSPTLKQGFLLPVLLPTDSRLYGRWDYLADAWQQGKLPDAPLPRIDFLSVPDKATWHMITRSLDAIPNNGRDGWQGWSSFSYFRYLLEWLLHGFHHAGHLDPPAEPAGCEGASERLHKTLDLALWQSNPYDYIGDLLAQNAYGKRQGFYPTPHSLAELMAQMTIGLSGREGDENGEPVDTRVLTVCDPCVGTGRLLLHASNYSMRLYGQDIDGTLCLATLVNGYLFMPWLIKPLAYLDRVQYVPEASARISDSLTAQAPIQAVDYLSGSVHDTEQQWKFEPVKKRKKAGAEPAPQQGMLFDL